MLRFLLKESIVAAVDVTTHFVIGFVQLIRIRGVVMLIVHVDWLSGIVMFIVVNVVVMNVVIHVKVEQE
jgi:hypothetical protein